MPPKKSELPGSPKIQELDEEEADESPPLLPMTPESKQLAAVIATAVATAMAGSWKISPARQQQLDGEVFSRRFFGFSHEKHYQHRSQLEASSCDVAWSQSGFQ